MRKYIAGPGDSRDPRGSAFSLKDTFTIFDEMKIPVTSIRLRGGVRVSPLWRQIQADFYGREVDIVAAEEDAAYGAANLAGTGAGQWSSVEQACDSGPHRQENNSQI